MWRIVVLVGLVLGMAMMSFPQPALACSCVPMEDVGQFLGDADAAFVGTLSGREDAPSDPLDVTWTFDVEQGVKGELGETVDVQAPANSGACGFQFDTGHRTGLLLYERDGQWHSGLCNQVSPDALVAAAEDLPPPTEPAQPATDEQGAPDWWLVLLLVIVIVAGIRLGLVWLSGRRAE